MNASHPSWLLVQLCIMSALAFDYRSDLTALRCIDIGLFPADCYLRSGKFPERLLIWCNDLRIIWICRPARNVSGQLFLTAEIRTFHGIFKTTQLWHSKLNKAVIVHGVLDREIAQRWKLTSRFCSKP